MDQEDNDNIDKHDNNYYIKKSLDSIAKTEEKIVREKNQNYYHHKLHEYWIEHPKRRILTTILLWTYYKIFGKV